MAFLAVCALGVSAAVTQLVLMRELLGAFAGNEMVFGVILGNWLLLTGLGARLGRSAGRLKRPLVVLVAAQLAVAVLPTAEVLAVRLLRDVVFMRGAVIGPWGTVLSCLVVLLPYCLISGYLLTLACSVLARKPDAASIGQVYFLDSLGDILGGLAFTFLLVHVFSHFGCLYVVGVLNALLAAALAGRHGRKVLPVVGLLLAAGLAALATATDLDELTTRLACRGFRVLFRGQSPYGRLVVTESAGQVNFIENGLPLLSTGDLQQAEETAHYAMAQRPRAKRVLLVGGAASGTAREVLKYGVSAVDYVELDGLIVRAARRFVPEALADARIRVIEGDGRTVVRDSRGAYDVLIVDLPDPSTVQVNRYYTREFFQAARRALAPGGVLAFSLGRYENYVSRELGRMLATARRTLQEVFRNVLVLPGGRVFFLAGDGELTADIPGRMEQAGVTALYMTPGYLTPTLSPDRLADMARHGQADARPNTDFSPVLYYQHLRYWMSHFRVSFGVLEVVLVLGLAACLVRLRRVPLAILTTGFAASSLEVVLLVVFQVLFGSVYHRVGLIVTAFMAGLAGGALLAGRVLAGRPRRNLAALAFAVAGYAAALPAVLMGMGGFAGTLVGETALPLLTALLGALVGMAFPVAARADFDGTAPTASRLYAADLAGASIGALLTSTLLIPLVGIVYVCLLTAGLNVLSGVLVGLSRKIQTGSQPCPNEM